VIHREGRDEIPRRNMRVLHTAIAVVEQLLQYNVWDYEKEIGGFVGWLSWKINETGPDSRAKWNEIKINDDRYR